MPGTLNIALTQQFDMDGNPLSGGLLYFFQAASTIPQNAFQDIALTILHPNPIILPADGRVPMFYLASTASEGNPSGQIKIRITDYTGVTILAADSLLIIGPASGGGGGSTGGGVDATSVFTTGDVKPHFGTEDMEGWVQCNGETIGSELSSAKYFGAEFEFLFKHLWNTGVLQVFAGTVPARGATANEDWDANRRILLPDLRGRVIVGLDDMGSTVAGRLTAALWGTTGAPTVGNPIILGDAGGDEGTTLVTANLPTVTPAGTVTGVSGSGSSAGTGSSSGSFSGSISGTSSGHSVPGNTGNTPSGGFGGVMAGSTGGVGGSVAVGDGTVSGSCSGSYSGGASVTGSASISGGTGTFTGTPFGSNTKHRTAMSSMTMTFFIKL